MSKEVVQKEFHGGLFRLIGTWGLLAVCIAAFNIWQGGIVRDGHEYMDPELFADTPVDAKPAFISGALDSSRYEESSNRCIPESDVYLVARHNLTEGTVLRASDLKVVKMPGLNGYELAFFSPEAVIGMVTAHAVPEGQPVLPYHVEYSLKHRKYCKPGAPGQE